MYEKIKCKRCGKYDEIPTHQFVKFDEKMHYLCGMCWEEFRRWMVKGNAALNHNEEKG